MFRLCTLWAILLLLTSVGTLLNCGFKTLGPNYTMAADQFDWFTVLQFILFLGGIFFAGLLEADRRGMADKNQRLVLLVTTALWSLPIFLAAVFLVMIPCVMLGVVVGSYFLPSAPRSPMITASFLFLAAGLFAFLAQRIFASSRPQTDA